LTIQTYAWAGFLFFGWMNVLPLNAQTVPPLTISSTGINPVDFEFRTDGTLIAEGNIGIGSLLSGDQGNGTRFLWFPSLAAFRAGSLDDGGTEGNQAEIGQASVAMGNDNLASGKWSFAVGGSSTATQTGSISIGISNISGGYNSVVLGQQNTGYGAWSVTMGIGNLTTTDNCVAIGSLNQATGVMSLALGASTSASGRASATFNTETQAQSCDSSAFGTYNIGGGNATEWVATDPLFEIGNGTATTPHDALFVDKSGNVAAAGIITAAPGGDIPMYTGQ